MENHFPKLGVIIYITHVHNCVIGATPMKAVISKVTNLLKFDADMETCPLR